MNAPFGRSEYRGVCGDAGLTINRLQELSRPSTSFNSAARWTRCLLAIGLSVTISGVAQAQGRSEAYVSVGLGATQLAGGLDWLIMNAPVGLGVEAGVGNMFLVSVFASYHPLARRPMNNLDPFATVSFTGMSDLNNDASGVSVGGGLTYWARRRVGIRLDGFSFFPTHDDISKSSVGTSPHFWGVRAGIAIHVF
jgi:hypothetical protein